MLHSNLTVSQLAIFLPEQRFSPNEPRGINPKRIVERGSLVRKEVTKRILEHQKGRKNTKGPNMGKYKRLSFFF